MNLGCGSGGAKERTTDGRPAVDGHPVDLAHVAAHQTFESFVDREHAEAFVQRETHGGTDGRVHSGRRRSRVHHRDVRRLALSYPNNYTINK